MSNNKWKMTSKNHQLYCLLQGRHRSQKQNWRTNYMKLIAIVLACIALSLIIIACTEKAPATNNAGPNAATSPAAAASPVDEFATSRANFHKHCEGCHGETGEGGLVKVENKRIKVPSLKAEHAIKHTDEQITKMITNGEEQMPSFKDKMSPQEISQMVRFVRKNFQGK
jgi:mono/diheme cytochrome c family protein